MKKFVCLLLTLLLLTAVGCNSKSFEMTLNDGVLENDFFSIDVSGYDDVKYTVEALQSEEIIGFAYSMAYTNDQGQNKVKQCVEVHVFEDQRSRAVPNQAYFEASATSKGGQLVSYKNLNNDPTLGAIVQYLYLEDGKYYHHGNIMMKAGSLWFNIYFYDGDGTEEIFPAYTTAIDSFKVK